MSNNLTFCDCCAFPTDDLNYKKIEKNSTKKEIFVCDFCFKSPYVLDAWLNPEIYEDESRKILTNQVYCFNILLEKLKNDK